MKILILGIKQYSLCLGSSQEDKKWTNPCIGPLETLQEANKTMPTPPVILCVRSMVQKSCMNIQILIFGRPNWGWPSFYTKTKKTIPIIVSVWCILYTNSKNPFLLMFQRPFTLKILEAYVLLYEKNYSLHFWKIIGIWTRKSSLGHERLRHAIQVCCGVCIFLFKVPSFCRMCGGTF